jgi:hypothetical protein
MTRRCRCETCREIHAAWRELEPHWWRRAFRRPSRGARLLAWRRLDMRARRGGRYA